MSDINLIISATDKATPVLKRVNRQVDRFSAKSKRATNSGLAMGKMMKMAGAAALAIGLTKVVSSTVKTIAQFDSLKAMLKTVTGSADGALVAFEQIKKFTAETPFQLGEVTNAFSILKRNGIDTSTESLTAFGNIAAANGKTFEQFAEALGDAVTGEFERMKEFGIKVKKEGENMVAFMGSTQIGMSDSAEGIIDIFKELGVEGGRYATGLADQADTIGGKWSNLQDAMAQFQADVGEGGLNTVLKEVTVGLSDMFNSTGDLAKQIGAGLGAAIRTAMFYFKSMGIIVQTVVNGISELFHWVGGMIEEPVRNALNTVAGYLATLYEKFETAFVTIRSVANTAINNIANTIEVWFKNTKAIVQNFPDLFNKAWEEISRVAPEFGKTLVAQIIHIGESLVDNFKIAVGNIPEAFNLMYEAVVQGVPLFGKALIRQIINVGKTFATNIGIAIKNAPEAFNLAFETIVQGVPLFGEALIKQIIEVGKYLITNVKEIVTNLPQMFNRAWEAITQSVTNFGSAVVDQFAGIGKAVKTAWKAIWSDEISWEDAVDELMKNQFSADKFKLDLTDFVGVEFKGLENQFKGLKLELPETTFDQFKELENQFKGLSLDLPEATFKKFKEIDNLFVGKDFSIDIGLDEILLNAEEVMRIMNQDRTGDFLSQEWVVGAVEGLRTISDAAMNVTPMGMFKEFTKQYDLLIAEGVANQKALEMAIKRTEAAQKSLNNTNRTETTESMNAVTDSIMDQHMALNTAEYQWSSFEIATFDAIRTIKDGIEGMVGTMTDQIYDMFTGVTTVMGGLRNIAASVFQMIAKAVIQTMIVKPIIGMLTGTFFPAPFANGGLAAGGNPAIVGENGPEVIVPSGNSRVFSNSQSAGMLNTGSDEGPLTVNFNLNAVSTRDGVEFLIENKSTITSVIQEAYQTRGRNGPLG
jgi:phage-related protein